MGRKAPNPPPPKPVSIEKSINEGRNVNPPPPKDVKPPPPPPPPPKKGK